MTDFIDKILSKDQKHKNFRESVYRVVSACTRYGIEPWTRFFPNLECVHYQNALLVALDDVYIEIENENTKRATEESKSKKSEKPKEVQPQAVVEVHG